MAQTKLQWSFMYKKCNYLYEINKRTTYIERKKCLAGRNIYVNEVYGCMRQLEDCDEQSLLNGFNEPRRGHCRACAATFHCQVTYNHA